MSEPLEGIYVALTTPFEGDGVSAARIKENVRRLNATSLAGYLVLGSTGESVSLTDAESLELVEAVLEAAAPAKRVLVGTAREWTKGTIEFTAALPDRGIAAVLVRPPSYFKSKMTREALKAHFLAVAEASPFPVLLYNMPANTGINLEPRLVIDLAAHPNVAGLKESGGSLSFLAEVVREVPDRFHYLLGSGHVVYPGLTMGACGAILAVANAVPEMCAEIFRLFRSDAKDEARRLQLDLVPLNRALVEGYGIAGLKYAQDLRGYHGGTPRLPLLPVDDKGKAEIAALLKGAGLHRIA
jgi:4-hydroxy-2-oxoglutarate aldolase